uniref:PNK FHA domain-containing protein n=2 Tax=Phlebotomus papatasi TaxID=29031 RepID=A0A1B0D571_PHLPP
MENPPARECLLQSVDRQLRDVKISEEISFIGRSPDTEIQDEFCSRKQVMVKADFSSRTVELEAQGINPSALNGKIMEKKKPYRAIHGDVLEVVAGKFPYKILFSPELPSVKRKIDESPEQSPAKVAKKESWTGLDGNQLYVWTASGVMSSPKIASYDIDGTIIKTKSGNVFPKNIDDWMLAYPEVPGKLKKYHGEGFKVVFFTNQAAISKKKLKIEDFVNKVKKVVGKINIPIQVFISTGKGIYRKPMIGMWRKLEEEFNDGVKIDMKESFFVGDAAGRTEAKGRKKDHSCSDRFMAINLGLTFFTPEEHFQGTRALPWARPEFDPKNIVPPKTLLEPAGTNLMADHKEIIVMVGSPGSGKSSFVQRSFQGSKYDIVNRDKLGTWQKCVTAAQSALDRGRSVVVDNTNPDIESRKRYTDLAKKVKCRCRCFVMSTTLAQSRHNITFRELTDPAHVKINDIILNSYKSKFKEPQTSEGFEEIVRVNFVPSFQNSDHEELYRMYLLEK